MRYVSLPLAAAALAVAAIASAQLTQEYREWPDSPAGILLTKAERKAYDAVKSDAEAKAFIELFWAKRDPDLETPLNEYRSEFDMRVEAADKYFSYGHSKGSQSDRGKVLILFGKYSQRHLYRPGELAAQTGERNTRGDDTGNNEVWTFTKDQLPPGFKGNDVMFVFTESRFGSGDYILDRTDRRNAGAMRAMAMAPESLLLHPKLTEVPRLGMLPGSKAATSDQLAVLGTEPRPWPEGSAVMSFAGVLSESIHPLWLLVQLPDSAPVATQAIGRVVSADTGVEAGNFVVGVKPTTANGGQAYEFSFPVDAGTWRVDLALIAGGSPIAILSHEAATEAIPKDGTFLSGMYWGIDIRQEVQARLGDPLNIGGWHVLPRPSAVYSPREQLSYFCFVIRPGLPEEPAGAAAAAPAAPAKPKLEISMVLFLDGKKVSEVPATPVNLSNIRGDLWMFGNGMPLEGFRRAGEYRLELTLKDTISGVSRTSAVPITIPAEPATAEPAGS